MKTRELFIVHKLVRRQKKEDSEEVGFRLFDEKGEKAVARQKRSRCH